MEHLLNDYKDHPNQHKNSHKLCDEMGLPFVNLMENEFPNGGKTIVEQTLVSEERTESKRTRLWDPQSGMQVGKLTIW